MIEFFINTALVYLLAIIVHEIGHAVAYFFITKKIPNLKITWAYIGVGDPKTMCGLNPVDQIAIICIGPLFGLAFIVLFSDSFMAYLLVLLHLYGSRHDFGSILQIYNKSKSKLTTQKLRPQ